MTIVGTRPEIIKLSSVISLLDKFSQHILVHTGQNYDYELNEIFFLDLKIRKPDYFLGVNGGSPANLIGNIIISADKVLDEVKPDAVLIYGDTNSCLSIISAKRRKIPIFHLEAGNRSFNQNVPEELNRKIVDHLSDINITLTEHARRYLISEGLKPETIFKVGSLMPEVLANHIEQIEKSNILERLNIKKGQYFVASLHREENVDQKENLIKLLASLEAVSSYFSMPVYLSTHPRTKDRIDRFQIVVDTCKVKLIKPVGFHDYNKLQLNSYCVLSDSGTLTEESSILSFPGVMLRNVHERPEAFDSGVVLMANLEANSIIDCIKIAVNFSRKNKDYINPISDFRELNVSQKIIKLIYSYTNYVDRYVWQKS